MNGSVFPTATGSELTANYVTTDSAIHKAGGFMVHGHSIGLPGIIPVEQTSVYWLSMGASGRNDLLRSFCTAAGHMAAL